MKRALLTVAVIIIAAIALTAFTNNSGLNSNPPQEQEAALFPEDVQKILETSCYDCHTDEGSNLKAKTKLNFSKWNELSDARKVGKMEGINEQVRGGDMPPGKYVSKYPDKALNQEQKELINKWITEETAKLMGE